MIRPIDHSSRLNGLYVITSGAYHLRVARGALVGGARLIQLRDQQMPPAQLLETARELRRLTREFDSLFFVCDHLELAREVEADGVHLEYSPLSLEEARREVGEQMLLSTGVGSVERALRAQDAGADYLGIGPVFPTYTKKDAGPAIGFKGLEAIRAAVSIPLVAIGGLSIANIRQVSTEMAGSVAALAEQLSEFEVEMTTHLLLEELASRVRE